MDLPAVAKLKSLSTGTKLGIEAILYTLTAYAEQKLSDQSPLGLMAKTVLMDAAPEIASRLMKDARADLSLVSSIGSGVPEPQQSVAGKLLAMEDGALLAVLTSMEDMDDATRGKFLSFAASASKEELAKFGSLPEGQRSSLLLTHGVGQGVSSGGWAASFKAFAKDFWVVFKAWSQKTGEVSLRALNRYMRALLWVLKASAVLWGMAFLACTASVIAGRWSLFGVLLGLVAVSGLGVFAGKRWNKSWLAVAGIVSAVVMALLALVSASGYAESVFGVAVLFLVGLPTLAIVTLLLPVTAVFEILRSLFPSGHKTLVRAFQMLLAAFFGILFFAVVLLVFPPQNPVAFLFIVPLVIALALGVGFGLVRVNPEMFLRAPVVVGMAVVLLVTLGVLSMPNLRHKLRTLPRKLDSSWVATPKPVTFASSKDIEFVTVDGDVRVWYAERSDGGYDLFRCEGVGPYYASDGRRLTKADSDTTRQKISAWVDRVAAENAEAQRKAEQERAARALAQQVEDQKRQAEETAKAEENRRASYLLTTTLPAKVDYIVCAASASKESLADFASLLEKQIQAGGKAASALVFAPPFIAEGGFEMFHQGKGGADIAAMPLSAMGTRLLLARCDEVTSKSSSTVAGLFNSTVKMSFRVLDAADGRTVDTFQLSAVGPGTSEADAKKAAFERILEQLSKRSL
ncbi:MAG: hypothetical protein M9910_04695 [Kiritimatiellae bacterium]|nr:hypothetical protein [Kiritimatiellia bacterium]